MENITISPVKSEHVSEILPHVLAFRKELFPMLDQQDLPEDLTHFENIYINDLSGAFLQARTTDGKLAGLIGMKNYDYRFPHLEIDAQSTVEVARLYVMPDYRRCGLGTLLFQELVLQARQKNIARLYLHTHPFLRGACQFWLRQGFRLIDFCEESGFPTFHMEQSLVHYIQPIIKKEFTLINNEIQY